MRGGGLIFSEGAPTCSRAKERRNIFHCVIPYPSSPPQSEKKRVFVDATARRGDGIAAKFLRSLWNPFSLRLRRTGSAGGASRALRPEHPPDTARHDGRARVPRSRLRLTKPGLNLSRAFVDPLACRPFARRASPLRRRACSVLSAARTAAEGFSFDINTRGYRERYRHRISMYAPRA